ncbi:FeoC-like transcriptional regulator [Clostridium tagluense]|uniref:Transcriptional regulator n=1 Tax=Clostridium tagluense TaxID=360422 RepID=A0A401UK70_9CLOT|nr:FeoC-like transcriptional regulator [Clostridium tagluense]GCD09944.1 transcriptional regulator [Clostridium tagluense]
MLIKILKSLAKGGRYSNKLMAIELGVDESLIEQMIDKLLHMGYIEKEKINSCGDGCGCCSSKKSCGSGSKSIDINIWKVTEKGKKAICN